MGDRHPTVRPEVTVSSLIRRKWLGSGLFQTNFERFHHEFLFHGMPVRGLLELKAQIMSKNLNLVSALLPAVEKTSGITYRSAPSVQASDTTFTRPMNLIRVFESERLPSSTERRLEKYY